MASRDEGEGQTSGLAYPSADAADVVMRDGTSIRFRPVRAEDGECLRAFLEGVSSDSMIHRFFGVTSIDWITRWAVDVDYKDRYALVAELGAEREIVAHGVYAASSEHTAEVAFLVTDRQQGQGIATLMLMQLASIASRHGFEHFTAEVLPDNYQMIEVFRTCGLPCSIHNEQGVVQVELETALDERALEAFDRRVQAATRNALHRFLAPSTVAVIGATERAGSVGAALMDNLLKTGFSGAIYPVNPHAEQLCGLAAYPSIDAVPGPVDMAVIAVPAPAVPDVAAACAVAGVRAMLVISAGFGETGEEGRALQDRLLEVCRHSGARLIGPNCLGLVNTDPAVRLNATFTVSTVPRGNVGVISQSGGLGIALIEEANRLGLGVSSFVSVGNKLDISGNDLLEYWELDPATDLILLYLESFGNPRRFSRLARRVGMTKPILAVKSGRTPAGVRASSSHTGALLSASDVTVDALFRQAGVIRADTIAELFDTAALMSSQPLPRGRRVAIVTNGGGPGIVAADACAAAGLDVPELPAELQQKLRGLLPQGAAVGNPIDMVATVSAGQYQQTVELLLEAGVCDAILALFVPAISATTAAEVAAALAGAAAKANGVALASVFMDHRAARDAGADGVVVPRFQFPEDAARALANAVRHSEWRQRPTGIVPSFEDCDRERAAAIISGALARGGDGWLAPAEVFELFGCYRMPVIETRVVADEEQAVAAAAALGGAVVLKGIAPGLVHKSDSGAVLTGLSGADAVRAGAHTIRAAVTRAGRVLEGLIVQPMAAAGVELLLGVVHDPSFGPVLACGAGGTTAELLGDVAVRITPLSDRDASEMLESLRIAPLLHGYRGAPACDIGAVSDALLRLGAMVEAHSEIAELDASPLFASADGAVIVDARVRVGPAMPARPLGALRN
jgi:acetyl coenzyme A synthetase (ADP forming)-like protein